MTIDYENLCKAIIQTLIAFIAMGIITLLVIATKGIMLIVLFIARIVYMFYLENKYLG